MIKSMTGFGRGEANDEKRNVVCEIRAVNHRYCDISVRMPRRYSFVEEKIKQAVKEKIARGKLDVSVSVENTGAGDLTIQVNPDLACQYMENLALLRDKLGLADEGAITLEYVATLPDVLKTVPAVEDEEEITRTILAAVRAAVARLDEMRILEGEKLEDDLLSRGRTIKALVAEIETLAEDVPKTYAEKLRNRIRDLIGDAVEIPEDRIMLEAAVFADKCSIAEEITRLKSHMDHMEEIIAENGQPDGKRLDFLVQEMNREANTIGSKANDLEITGLMLKIKAEVEKIREQVQNVE
ncbi:MAG: YicC family protein [Firmicutes bacterium]|nr:YicC family protein [Bacillota bacterium]